MARRDRAVLTLTFFIILFSVCLSFAENYVTAKPEQGDGIYTLLRRYKLPATSQYVQVFRDINSELLKQHGSLQVGIEYKLPVLRYRFNGKTIRSTLGINDYPLAKQIDNYNIAVVNAGLKKQSYKVDKELWVPWHLSGNTEQGENFSGGKKQRHDIFGPQYRDVELIDNQLEGRVFYLVSGHGGPDPGAIGRRGSYRLYEDEYAYDITLRFTRRLVEHGAKVYVIVRDPNDGIRDQEILRGDRDEVYYGGIRISSNAKTRLDTRAEVINSLYQKNSGARSQQVIVLHVDSRSNKKRIDIFYYYQPNNRQSRDLAWELYRTIRDKYNQVQPGRGYKGTVETRNLHMLRNCKPSTVYIELGNIRNPLDQQRFMLENNRQAVANWLCLGVLNHYK